MRIFGAREAGTSLLELIVSIALIGMISGFVGEYYRRSQLAEYEQRSRAKTHNQIDLGITTLKRDLERRIMGSDGKMSALGCGSNCTSFEYRRMAKRKAGGDNGSYVMAWTSYCQGMPANVLSRFEKRGLRLDISRAGINKLVDPSNPHYPTCLALKDCGYGTYSQIVRHWPTSGIHDAENNSAVIPTYPWSIFPQNSQDKEMSDGAVAAAICGDTSNPANDKIYIDVAIVTNDRSLRFERREIIIPRKAVSTMQVLAE